MSLLKPFPLQYKAPEYCFVLLDHTYCYDSVTNRFVNVFFHSSIFLKIKLLFWFFFE